MADFCLSRITIFIILLCSLISIFGGLLVTGKTLKCYQCTLDNDYCEFIPYVVNPGQHRVACKPWTTSDNVKHSPYCFSKKIRLGMLSIHFEIIFNKSLTFILFEGNFYYHNRSCGPVDDCENDDGCCICKKSGCNGNNDCTFNSSSLNSISIREIFLIFIIIKLVQCYPLNLNSLF